MEKLVTIELFGQPYTFKVDAEIEEARKAADALVQEVAKAEQQHEGRAAQTSRLTIMILAALNLASENMELKGKNLELLEKVTTRSDRLIRLLDAHIS